MKVGDLVKVLYEFDPGMDVKLDSTKGPAVTGVVLGLGGLKDVVVIKTSASGKKGKAGKA